MINALTDEILSLSRYTNNQIIYIDKEGRDYKVKDEITYGSWTKTYKDIPHIKVEGLEDKSFHLKVLKDFQLDNKVNSVHLFYNQYGGFSFPEHADDTNVLLYIVKGSKKVYIDKHSVLVKEEQAVFIPKGLKHKVDSSPNTWALSIGFD
jgi:mannose-6-phosphate isomerase-like protein (cupin superfamily)